MATTILTKQAYQKAQVKGTHELAPRVGHYVFQKYKLKTTSKGQQVAVMETLWKPFNEPDFIENLIFEVAIRTFYSIYATGPKHIDSNDLINRMIIVKEVSVADNIVRMKWDIIDENPVISKPKSLFGMAPMSYDDINRMNGRLGIDDNPDGDQPFDSPDDL